MAEESVPLSPEDVRKAKQQAYMRAYRQRHREKLAAYQRDYHQAHTAERAEAYRQWLVANAEHRRAYARRYATEHAKEIREQRRTRAAQHRQQLAERQKRYNAAHREHINRLRRERDAKNRPTINARQMAAYRAHHDRYLAYSHEHGKKRRARKKGAGSADFTAKQWRAMLRIKDYRCEYCGEQFPARQLEQDHITPVSAGGPHTLWNIVPACITCNRRKGPGPVLSPAQPLLLVA